MSAKTVFISYRRDPIGKLFAGRIFDSLTHEGYDVFLDVENIGAGDWKPQLIKNINESDHFLMLLTPNSLADCNNSEDMVKFEYDTAVSSNKNIVPVKEESEKLSDYKNCCPSAMKAIFDKQILELRHNSFSTDIDELIQKYIAPHKVNAFIPSNSLFTYAKENKFLTSVVNFFRSAIVPFIDNLLTFLVVASFVFVLHNEVNSGTRDFFYFIVIAITLKGFVSIFSLPKELRTVATVALISVACGSSILVGKYQSRGQLNDPLSIFGFVSSSFGLGMATVVPGVKKYRNGFTS